MDAAVPTAPFRTLPNCSDKPLAQRGSIINKLSVQYRTQQQSKREDFWGGFMLHRCLLALLFGAVASCSAGGYPGAPLRGRERERSPWSSACRGGKNPSACLDFLTFFALEGVLGVQAFGAF